MKIYLGPSELRSMAWLCEMAALGCLDTNRSAWAAQLRNSAKDFRRYADQAESGQVDRVIRPGTYPRP